jgi:hypothetical protein
MDPAKINNERSLRAWLSDKPEEWAQTVALRAALRALPYIGTANDYWLRNFGLLPFRAVLTSWIQLTRRSLDVSKSGSRANAAFGGFTFDTEGYNEDQVAAHAADASYHSAEAQSRSLQLLSDCIEGINKAAEAFRLGPAWVAVPPFDEYDGAENYFWYSVATDCEWLESDDKHLASARRLALKRLWLVPVTTDWNGQLSLLEHKLPDIDQHYPVWFDWYERRVGGEHSAFDIPSDKGRKENKKILRRLAEATDEDFWSKGHEYVNATLKSWLDEARARCEQPLSTLEKLLIEDEPKKTSAQIIAALEQQASPQAQIVDGKLDAAPNTIFDKPQYSDNLASLPSELLAFTDVILNSLPRNCQPVVRNCFTGFRDEMLVRGNRPIVNIVKAMAASLTAELYGEPDPSTNPDEWKLKDPREWGAGMDSMFASFFKGYHDLIHHFPMDSEREKLIADTPIDEVAASGAVLTAPVDAVAEMIIELGKQGFATDNIVRIIEAHQLYNRDVSQLPNPSQPYAAVTPKQRHILGTAGFYLNTYSVIGSTASLYALQTVPAVQALIPKLKDAADAFLAFIK